MSIAPDVLSELKPQPYKDVRSHVRDGDLLLCSARDQFSRLIRWGTQSSWSHVAVAFRMENIDRVMVLECVEKFGVRAVPLSAFLARTSGGISPYPGQILLARHKGMAAKSRSAPLKRMAGFAFDHLGDPFSQFEMAKIVMRIFLNRFDVRLPPTMGPKDEFICSEFVAKCFEVVDLRFAWDGLGFIAPSDIANDPHVEAVAQFQV